ncbi:MAG: tetratricopeptide repeat protein [Bacteroidetes bacterium]|nr:tetratricopeptide repeat protein [Bacteroidota bacterium]
MSFLKNLFSGKNQPQKTNSFKAGDIFYTKNDSKFSLFKLLVHDAEFDCYHVLVYMPVDRLPDTTQVNGLKVMVYHSPFATSAFSGAVLLVNTGVKSDDLIGYHEYLRQTQAPEHYVPLANKYYQTAYELTNEKKYHEAIDEYSKAVDLFPAFFEAIDNRAFCKMDLGLWNEAIEDFKLSLMQNPGTVLAEFSIGECYFKMRDYENARKQFEKAHQIDPDDPMPIKFLAKVNELLGR